MLVSVEVQRETSQSREHNSCSHFPALVVTPCSMKDMETVFHKASAVPGEHCPNPGALNEGTPASD